MKWHNQKEDGQNKEHTNTEQIGNWKFQILQSVHSVMR